MKTVPAPKRPAMSGLDKVMSAVGKRQAAVDVLRKNKQAEKDDQFRGGKSLPERTY